MANVETNITKKTIVANEASHPTSEPIIDFSANISTIDNMVTKNDIISRNNRNHAVNHQVEAERLDDLFLLFKAISLVMVVCIIYAFLIHEDIDLDALFAPYFSLTLIPILSIFALWFMLKSKYSMATFGLTLKNWQHSIKEAVYCSLFIMLVAVFLKAMLVQFSVQYAGQPIFALELPFTATATRPDLLLIAHISLYILFSPLQEMLARGFMQGLLYRNLSGVDDRKRLWFSIIMANLIFGFSHLHLSTKFAITSIFLGMFWGWLYARNKTLIGPSVSHILVGIWCLFIVGFIP